MVDDIAANGEADDAGSRDGAIVGDAAADISDDVGAADDRAVLNRLLISGGEIDHGNEDFAARNGRFNIPDKARLEAGDLGTSERDADAELKPLGLRNTSFKQPACLRKGITEAAELGFKETTKISGS